MNGKLDLSLTHMAQARGLTIAEVIDGVVNDTLAITLKNVLPPGRNELHEYVVTPRKTPIGPAREHVSAVLAVLQENLDSVRQTARYHEQYLNDLRHDIAGLETLSERMARRLEALVLEAQEQERQQKAIATGQRKIVLDKPTRTPVA